MTIRQKVQVSLTAAALVFLGLIALYQAVLQQERATARSLDSMRTALAAADDTQMESTKILGMLRFTGPAGPHDTSELIDSIQRLGGLIRPSGPITPAPATRAAILSFMQLATACAGAPQPDAALQIRAHDAGHLVLTVLKRERDDVLRRFDEAQRRTDEAAADRALLHLLSSLSFVAIVLLLGRSFTHSVLRPLEALRHRMLRVEAGIYGEPLAQTRNDELGPIFEAFDRLSVALRARAREQEARVRRIEGIASITSAASWPIDARRFLQDALARTIQTVENDLGLIRLVDPETRRLKLAAVWGVERGLGLIPEEVEHGQYLAGLTVQSGEPLVVDDVNSDPRMGPMGFAGAEHLISMVGVPISSRGRNIGCILVGARRHCRYSPEDVALLQTVGRVLGAAVENARLAQETAGLSRDLSTLLDLARAAFESPDIETLGSRALEILARPLRADCGLLAVVDSSSGELVTRAALGRGRDALCETAWPPDEGSAIAEAFASRLPLFIPDAASDPRRSRMLAEKFGYRSYFAVPIFHDQRPRGVIVLGSTRPLQPVDPALLPLVTTASGHLAFLIENMHLRDSQRRRSAGEGLPVMFDEARGDHRAEKHAA
jgi:GAF domain-containing protein